METSNHFKNGANRKARRVGQYFKYKTMVTVIVQHEVKDFAKWKIGFDEDLPNLKKAGVELKGLYTSFKKPNDVTMIFKAPDASLFNKIMSDPERLKAIEKAGVTTKPKVTILNKV